MNVLIDIGHPGHVHLLRNLFLELKLQGNTVLVTTKEIRIVKELLKIYKIPYISIGRKRDSILGKVFSQFIFNYKIWRLIRANHIEIGIGTSVSLAHISRISSFKSILLDDDDDEVQPLFVNYTHPFADYLVSPDTLKDKRKRKDTIYYPGLHEMAYLHPDRFKPDQSVLTEIGLAIDEPFFILRFNIFKAHHDIDAKGLSLEQKQQLLDLLLPHGRILITTEREVEQELKPYQLKISPEKIHSLLFYAKMFIGDSQTMTSEAAILGIPAITCNTFAGRLSNLIQEEEKYGLTYGFRPHQFNNLIEKVKELLSMKDLSQQWEQKRQKLLKDKMDPTKFYLWLIEYNEQIAETEFNEEFFSQFK